jgi:hypothetical protein
MPIKRDYHADYLQARDTAKILTKQVNTLITAIWHNRKEFKEAEMTHREFTELVREMRFNQKQYFKHRTQGFLEKSKALEKQVDQILTDTAKTNQPSLF